MKIFQNLQDGEDMREEIIGICSVCGKNVTGYTKDEALIIEPCIHFPKYETTDEKIKRYNNNIVKMVEDMIGVKEIAS
jgi:hypothetical protein